MPRVPNSKAALHPRRIDWTVVNRAAHWARAQVRVHRTLGLPVRTTHWVAVPAGQTAKLPSWAPPPSSHARNGGGAYYLRSFWRACGRADLDKAWAALEQAAASWHGEPFRAGRVEWEQAHGGRPLPRRRRCAWRVGGADFSAP